MTFNRRRLIAATGAAGLSLGAPGILRHGLAADDGAKPDIEKARKEGPLVFWHGDQEDDGVELVRAFTEATGIPAVQQRLLPGAALPKLEAEFRTGTVEVDVYNSSDSGMMEDLRKKGRLMRYESPEIAAYGPDYRSDPPGYWTAYMINIGPIMYDPRHVPEDAAPKSWSDLLDPRWKGQIGFQNAASGSQYAWWFLLQDVLPASFWDKLVEQRPRGYASSTQIVNDVIRGDVKIGGRVSGFQYVKSVRRKEPLKVVFPPEGTPGQSQVTGIIATTKRPNAAKAFVDFMLSRDGQRKWIEIEGAYSARADVPNPDLPPLASLKTLVPNAANFDRYGSAAEHARFVSYWNKATGF